MTAIELLEASAAGYIVPQKKKAARLDQCYEKSPSLLYFIALDGPEKFVKIGIASDINTRLSNAQSNCPYPLRILKVVAGAWHLEKSLHNRFADLHVQGEWFRLEGELEQMIASLP